MSTEKIADRHHHESAEGVVFVLDRMVKAAGAPEGCSYATALDVSPNTIKTWRRRGEVPMKFLTEFAKEHQVGIDYLRFGTTPSVPEPPPMAEIDADTLQAIEWVGDDLRAAKRTVTGKKLVELVRDARDIIRRDRERQRQQEADREEIRRKISAL